MANYWQDPAVVLQNLESLARVNLMVVAIIMWEWAINLGFEWRILTRQTEFKWPMLVCMMSRALSLGTAIATTVLMTVTTRINCDMTLRWIIALSYLSIALASVLIAFRAVAIWRHNKYIIVAVTVILMMDLGWMIYGIVPGVIMVWDPTLDACIPHDTSSRTPANIAAFACDVSLLIVMLVGLWRHKGTGSLTQLMNCQGVFWFLIATSFYVPEVAFIILNYNDPMNLMLQIPVAAATTICGNRMQLHLYNYTSPAGLGIELSRESERRSGATHRNAAALMP